MFSHISDLEINTAGWEIGSYSISTKEEYAKGLHKESKKIIRILLCIFSMMRLVLGSSGRLGRGRALECWNNFAGCLSSNYDVARRMY